MSSTATESNTKTSTKKEGEQKRPNVTTMEGMIWNAHHMLETALDPDEPGVPKDLFADCIAIALVSIVEVGFVLTGSVGSGIILRKDANSESGWSLPSACGLTGLGYGFIAGGSVKDVMVFIMDQRALEAMLDTNGLRIGTQAELTIGTFGRTAKLDYTASKNKGGTTVSVAFSKGLFGGISLSGAVIGARPDCNKAFYGSEVFPRNILNGNDITLPLGKVTLLNEVYTKLNLLVHGKVSVMDENNIQIESMKHSARLEAEKVASEMARMPNTASEVSYVDITVEAAKEEEVL